MSSVAPTLWGMSAPPARLDEARAEHVHLARRRRRGLLSPADLARYRALHRRLLCELLSGDGRVVLCVEELEAIDARGCAVDDLPRAVALGRAWWVTWADGGPPLLCEGASADEVLASLAGLWGGDEAHEHEGGAAAWARARGWTVRQLVGVVG